MRESEMFMFAVILAFVSGQEQYLREVTNPTGPSQIILRGGSLGGQSDQETRSPVQPPQQAVPLQANFDSNSQDPGFANSPGQIPAFNQFQPAPPQPTFPPQQQFQPVFQSQPQQQFQSNFQTQPQPQTQSQNQVNSPPQYQSFNQGQPLQQQPFQQFVDANGNVFTMPLALLNQLQTNFKSPTTVQKHALVDQYGRKLAEYETQVPAASPQTIKPAQAAPTVPKVPTQPKVPVQRHALVDQYGRKLAEYETPAQTIQQEVHIPAQQYQAHNPVQQIVQLPSQPVLHQQFVPQAVHPVAQHQFPVVQHQLPVVQHQVPVVHHQLPVVQHQVPVIQHHVPVVQQQVPVVAKQVVHVPQTTVIQQPILPKPLLQKHIFNVQHGSEPIIFQDICTTYPYQKNVPGCVLKKAVHPELHHPDVKAVRLSSQPNQEEPDQADVNSFLNFESSNVVSSGNSASNTTPVPTSSNTAQDTEPTAAESRRKITS